jgi:signal peptidase I
LKTDEPGRASDPVDAGDGLASDEYDSGNTSRRGLPEKRREGASRDGASQMKDSTSDSNFGVAYTMRSRLARAFYWCLWFALMPLVLAVLVIWALSPAGSAEIAGPFGWIPAVVRSQPVPVGIALFTVFDVFLWSLRHRLPLARHAHSAGRPDLPPEMRSAYERARSLIYESEAILAKHHKAIQRDLGSQAIANVRASLDALGALMNRTPFDGAWFMDTLDRVEREVDVRLGRWRKSETREYVEAIVMAVAVAFALRTFVVEAFKIPSGSMIPSLMVGDHIFVNKFSYGPAIPYTTSRVWTSMPPKRGDVIVFAFPEHPEQDFIKRVVALPGDTLEAKKGHPVINGWTVPSCLLGPWSYVEAEGGAMQHEGDLYVEYLGAESFLTFYDRASAANIPEYQGPFVAKPGEVWVMGDNRNNSHDSRMWFVGQGGGVPFANIRGRALFVWLSVSDTGIDLSREGVPVMGPPRLPPSAARLGQQLAACMRQRPAVTVPPLGR